MSADLLATLPLPQRLALAYAPRACRSDALALLAMDARLASIVRSGGEPVIAQMKLAWWRERLAQNPHDWPLGEPLLALLRESRLEAADLTPVVDGWEGLLAEELDKSIIHAFADARGSIWQDFALTRSAGDAALAQQARQAGREWAMVDLALHLGHPEDSRAVRDLALLEPWEHLRTPSALRPFAILHALASRALRREAKELLDGPGAMATVLRLGILGR